MKAHKLLVFEFTGLKEEKDIKLVNISESNEEQVELTSYKDGVVTYEIKLYNDVEYKYKFTAPGINVIEDTVTVKYLENTETPVVVRREVTYINKKQEPEANGVIEITIDAPKQRKLTELTNLEFKAKIKADDKINEVSNEKLKKINESETSITFKLDNLSVDTEFIYEIKSLDSEGQNEITPVSDSIVYKTTKVEKTHTLTFLKENNPEEENPEEKNPEEKNPEVPKEGENPEVPKEGEKQKAENKEPKYEGLDDFSEDEIKDIKDIMSRNSCYDHLRASRHFFLEEVEKSPANAVMTKDSLKEFMKEFKHYIFSRDDIKLYKILKEKLN